MTQENIIKINMAYLKSGTYAQAARDTGFSPSTIKKYIIPNFKPITIQNIKITLPPIEEIKIDWNKDITILSSKEEQELKSLWEEILI